MAECDLPMLVSTDWLSSHLKDADLRILDATVQIVRGPDGRTDARSGRDAYLAEHIPGAQFADVLHVLSDRTEKARFAIPSPERFARAMESLGVGEGTKVIVYSSTGVWWATRVWWLLRHHGFEAVAVLDGGFGKWKAEGRPVTSVVEEAVVARFSPKLDRARIATKQDVLDAISRRDRTVVVDTLSPEHFRGEAGDIFGYGRLGHIAGSINLPTGMFMKRDETFLDASTIADLASKAIGTPDMPVITYCGGGIAATQAAFALELAGRCDVRVYDGSLEEWAADPTLPMRTGAD